MNLTRRPVPDDGAGPRQSSFNPPPTQIQAPSSKINPLMGRLHRRPFFIMGIFQLRNPQRSQERRASAQPQPEQDEHHDQTNNHARRNH